MRTAERARHRFDLTTQRMGSKQNRKRVSAGKRNGKGETKRKNPLQGNSTISHSPELKKKKEKRPSEGSGTKRRGRAHEKKLRIRLHERGEESTRRRRVGRGGGKDQYVLEHVASGKKRKPKERGAGLNRQSSRKKRQGLRTRKKEPRTRHKTSYVEEGISGEGNRGKIKDHR